MNTTRTLAKLAPPTEPLATITRQRPMSLLKLCAPLWSTEQEPRTTKSMRYGLALNKPNLLPLPSTRQCPAYPFWMPTHAIKKYDHWRTQLSMQHDHESHQQNRLPRILLCLHDIGSSQQRAMQNLQITNTAVKWLFPTRFSGKNRFTSSPDAVLVVPIFAIKSNKQVLENWLCGGGRLVQVKIGLVPWYALHTFGGCV